MRSDLDGAAIDAAMSRHLTQKQLQELGALFAACIVEMAERRAARIAAEAERQNRVEAAS